MIRLPSLSDVKNQIVATATRFPLPTLCALVLTGLSIYITHDLPYHSEAWVWPTLFTAMLGVLGLTALTLATEDLKKENRALVMLGAVVLLGLYWWCLPADPDARGEGSQWWARHIFLMLGSLVALIWSPYWRKDVSNPVLWRWDTDVLAKLLITIFFAIVLFLGSAAALWSVDALFGLDIDEELYFDMWILAAALFSPLFFLSQLDKAPLKLKEPKTVDRFMGIFTKYIMTPIALVYLLILYAYTAKVLITWEWPKNVLGWLVICFLGVAIFTYFLWTPLLKPSWEKFRRIFWLVLLPQIFLLFVAIGWRIHAYSWTENRYFVVVLGLWLLGTTLYFLLKKDAKFKWAFVALTGVIFLSQIGPLSGYNIGKFSQTKRLHILLEDAKIRVPVAGSFDGHVLQYSIVPTKAEVNDEIENEIASIVDYLNNRHGRKVLDKLFPKQMEDFESHYGLSRDLMTALGLDYRSNWERHSGEHNQTFSYYIDHDKPRQISGYDWQVKPVYYGRKSDKKTSDLPYEFKMNKSGDTPAITVWQNDALIETIDITQTLEAIRNDHTIPTGNNLDPEKLVMWHESDLMKAKIYFSNIWGRGDKVESFNAIMYVRLKDDASIIEDTQEVLRVPNNSELEDEALLP